MRCQALLLPRLDGTKSVTESGKVDDAIVKFPSSVSYPPKNADDMLCYAALCYAFNFQAKYVVRDPFASRSEMLFNLHIMTNPPQSLHSPPSSTIHAHCVVWTNADTET